MWQDAKFAVRAWRRRPGFHATLAAMLALGMGATITVFALTYNVLWSASPIPQPDRYLHVAFTSGNVGLGLTPQSFALLRAAPGIADAVALEYGSSMQWHDGARDQGVQRAEMSVGLLSLFGLHPELGRDFSPQETAARAPVVLVSDEFWRTRLQADPLALGRTLQLDNRLYTIIGVLPAALSRGLEIPADVWLPLAPDAPLGKSDGGFDAWTRLRPGVNWRHEEATLTAYSKDLKLKTFGLPGTFDSSTLTERRQPDPDQRTSLLALLGAVGLVLLIACTNAAGLLLARGVEREPEMAVRRALGATRFRLLRQMLLEGLLLAAVAGGLGLLMSHWGIAWMRASPLLLPRLDETRLLPVVYAFALLAVVACALVCSLAPALRLTAAGGRRRQRARDVFVVAEVALALVLLVGAGLLANSLFRLRHVATGLDLDHLVTARLDTSHIPDKHPEQAVALAQRALAVIQGRPGWRSAALTALPPLRQGLVFLVSPPDGSQPHGLQAHAVGPAYFATVGQSLLAGRNFTSRDLPSSPQVIIVNQAWTKRYSPDQPALGLQLHSPGGGKGYSIVGVVSDARDLAPYAAPRPELYVPFLQIPLGNASLVINTAHPAAAVAPLRILLSHALPGTTVKVQTLRELADDNAQVLMRFRSRFLAAVAGLALLFALAGVWAQVAFAVVGRRRELAIRMALGAQSSAIFGQALRHIAALCLVGAAGGILGAWAATRLLSSMLFEVKPADPATFAAITLLFATAALCAAVLPARRALRIDPAAALRNE